MYQSQIPILNQMHSRLDWFGIDSIYLGFQILFIYLGFGDLVQQQPLQKQTPNMEHTPYIRTGTVNSSLNGEFNSNLELLIPNKLN